MVFNFHGSIELTEEQINDIVDECINRPESSIENQILHRLTCYEDAEYGYDYCYIVIPFIQPEIEKRLKNLEKPLDKQAEM